MTQRKACRFYVSRNSWAAQAEWKVRRVLEELPMDRFIVMNDVRIKYGNIDHLVLRDDGRIFIIETKSHRGRVSFDGNSLCLNGKPFKQNYFAQMNRNIRWIKEFIGLPRGKLWLTAILVFPSALVDVGRISKGTYLTALSSLVDSLCRQG